MDNHIAAHMSQLSEGLALVAPSQIPINLFSSSTAIRPNLSTLFYRAPAARSRSGRPDCQQQPTVEA
jgi:hypothetical protein